MAMALPGKEQAPASFGAGGAVSYRGMLFFKTYSPKLAHANNVCGAFEYEVDGHWQHSFKNLGVEVAL
jgi:hypothetical protein